MSKIIIHRSNTRPKWLDNKPLSAQVAQINERIENARQTSPYHYYLGRRGAMEISPQKTEEIPANINICLIGGYGGLATDNFRQHFTERQEMSLIALLRYLKIAHKITTNNIRGHNQTGKTNCPGFDVSALLRKFNF